MMCIPIYTVFLSFISIAYNNKILFSTAKKCDKRGCLQATTHWYKLDS